MNKKKSKSKRDGSSAHVRAYVVVVGCVGEFGGGVGWGAVDAGSCVQHSAGKYCMCHAAWKRESLHCLPWHPLPGLRNHPPAPVQSAASSTGSGSLASGATVRTAMQSASNVNIREGMAAAARCQIQLSEQGVLSVCQPCFLLPSCFLVGSLAACIANNFPVLHAFSLPRACCLSCSSFPAASNTLFNNFAYIGPGAAAPDDIMRLVCSSLSGKSKKNLKSPALPWMAVAAKRKECGLGAVWSTGKEGKPRAGQGEQNGKNTAAPLCNRRT